MLNYLHQAVPLCSRAWSEGETYYVALTDGTTREATPAEVLDAARASVAQRIRDERDRRRVEDGFPVTFPGVDGVWRFHSDLLSRSELLGLFALAKGMQAMGAPSEAPIPGAAGNPGYRTMGRAERVPMTVGRVLLLEQATLIKTGALHLAGEAHIAAVNALTDPAAVLAYDYSTGWPA